jgi:hypothetical protein
MKVYFSISFEFHLGTTNDVFFEYFNFRTKNDTNDGVCVPDRMQLMLQLFL